MFSVNRDRELHLRVGGSGQNRLRHIRDVVACIASVIALRERERRRQTLIEVNGDDVFALLGRPA